MFKRLVVLSALAVGTASVAHADAFQAGSYFSATGNDTFTSSTVTFLSANVSGSIGGTFATYLTDGTPVSFLSVPGGLPYLTGTNTPPPALFPTGLVPIFSVSQNGETFTFQMNQYSAGYITNNPVSSSGCNMGSTCLDITGTGFFTAAGTSFNATSGPATFSFSSQYVAGQPQTQSTTFSASTAAGASPAPVPEPSSLALFGTGLLGVVGIARRKMKI